MAKDPLKVFRERIAAKASAQPSAGSDAAENIVETSESPSQAAAPERPMHAETQAMMERSIEQFRDPDALILPCNSIVIPDDLLRKLDPAHALELGMSMKENGQHQPIIVDPLPDGRWRLVSGLHRLSGKNMMSVREPMELSHKQIRAVKKGSASALVIGYLENASRKQFTPLQEASALTRLKEEFGCDQKALAERVHKSPSYVSKFLALNEASEEVKAAIEAGSLSMKRWYENRDRPITDLVDTDQPGKAETGLTPDQPSADDATAGGTAEEQKTEAGEGSQTAKASTKKKKVAEQRIAVPLSVGRKLAEILSLLADQHALAPIEIKSRATKKDIQAAIIARAEEIREAMEGVRDGHQQ